MEDITFEEVQKRLSKISIFSNFNVSKKEDRAILEKLYSNLKSRNVKKNQIIIKEGDFGDEFYILYSGKVHVSRNTPQGDSIALADLDSSMNIFFGETALIETDKRTATVTALEDSKLLVLTSSAFKKLCTEEPFFGYQVLLKLSQRMAETVRQMNTEKTLLYQALYNEIAGTK